MFIFQLCPLPLMNCVLWEQKHIALYIFKASAVVHLSLCRDIVCFPESQDLKVLFNLQTRTNIFLILL